jgi:ribosomal protein L14
MIGVQTELQVADNTGVKVETWSRPQARKRLKTTVFMKMNE